MKIKKSAVFIIPAIVAGLFSSLNASPAGSAFLSGGNALFAGRAGTGVSAVRGDFSPVNPASMSTRERAGMSVNYGSVDGDYQ